MTSSADASFAANTTPCASSAAFSLPDASPRKATEPNGAGRCAASTGFGATFSTVPHGDQAATPPGALAARIASNIGQASHSGSAGS